MEIEKWEGMQSDGSEIPQSTFAFLPSISCISRYLTAEKQA